MMYISNATVSTWVLNKGRFSFYQSRVHPKMHQLITV